MALALLQGRTNLLEQGIEALGLGSCREFQAVAEVSLRFLRVVAAAADAVQDALHDVALQGRVPQEQPFHMSRTVCRACRSLRLSNSRVRAISVQLAHSSGSAKGPLILRNRSKRRSCLAV